MSDISTPQSDPGDPPSHQYRDRGRWIFPALLILAIAAAVTLRWLPKFYRNAKVERGLGLAEKARVEMDAKEWEAAAPHLKAALELAPKEPTVLRLVARLCDQYQMQEALTYWSFVLGAPSVTRADRQAYVASALANRRIDLAQEQLEKLALEDESDLETLRLTIGFLQQKGEPASAIYAARKAVERRPSDEGPQLALASLLVQYPDPERQAEGRSLLWALVAHVGPYQKDAIQILARDPRLNPVERKTLLSYVEALPVPTLGEKLGALALKIQVAPSSSPQMIREALKLGLPPASNVEVTQVLLWLVEQKAFKELLDFMPWQRAKQNVVWTFWHISALGSLERWRELKPRLEDKSTPLEPARRFGMLASMDFALGDTNGCRVDLQNAIAASSERPEQLVPLAQLAAQVGAPDLAMDAYARTLSFTPFARTACQQILLYGQLTEHPGPLIDACRRLLSFEPDNLTALNELAYTLFILRRSDPATEAAVEKIVARPGTPGGFKIDLALLRLVQGRANEALDIVDSLGADWKTAPLRWKLVYTATLGANNQNEAARRIARTIREDDLRPTERSWIKSWL